MRFRFEQTEWRATSVPRVAFVFAYGDFLDDQLRVTIGRLGESPWAAGGPDIWQELDNQVGIRTEIKPRALPGLNFGFVLNHWNNATYFDETFEDLLMESVFGISYSNDFFLGRLAYRLDGQADVHNGQEGHEFMYRLEPRFLSNLVPGLSVWANGRWRGFIGLDEGSGDPAFYNNWIYADYDTTNYFAQLSVRLHFTEMNIFLGRIGFYYKFTPYFRAGTAFIYENEFGTGRLLGDVPYGYVAIEPEIRASFGLANIALVYNLSHKYMPPRPDGSNPERTRHWLNLRAVINF
jgi:hypothetical protein